MSGSPTLREIRYQEKRRQLLETAARLFAQKGYEKVSLDQIAASLKLTKASLYHYFKSKDEIFFLIQMEAIKQANAGLEKVLAMDAGPAEKLREAIKSHVRIVTRDYVTGTFRQKELVLPGRFMNPLVEMRDRFEKNFELIILEGIKAGVFQARHRKLAVLSILGTLNAIPRWYSPRGELSVEEIGEALSCFIIKGLSPDSARNFQASPLEPYIATQSGGGKNEPY